jgi:uncharacterized protein YecE (DUF72 family)
MQHGTIRIGTCSWTEKSLVESGSFYPAGIASPEQRLKFYASYFDTVEVESSFYAVPTSRMVNAWCERTPAGFLFHLKALGVLTGHRIATCTLPAEFCARLGELERSQEYLQVSDPKLLQALAHCFVTAVEPLRAARRLGFIVFQFPPWFGHKKANFDYLLYCQELMEGLPIAVEFRHGSWLTRHHAEALFAFLRQHKITYITCDEPQYGTLATAPFRPEATTQMAYLRLHGRNAENWLNHATARYDYLYPDRELEQIAREIDKLSQHTRMLFIMFNNCHAGHSVTNALRLQELLQRQ